MNMYNILKNFILSLSTLTIAQTLPSQRPIYAIAHRVLRPEAVTAAISHGANALEIDLTAWSKEWWADHDGKSNSAGATARELFEFIAAQRQSGANIGFVWLDIKNPDYCEDGRGCSMISLRDLVRETLEPAGVQALYGFYQLEHSKGFLDIGKSLNANEAVVLSGMTSYVMEQYDETNITAAQRVMDYGWTQLDQGFGICLEEDYYTCTELRMGSETRDRGELGMTMGWTSTEGDKERVHLLLDVAAVDGIIYGFQESDYSDDAVPKAACQDILDFVAAHGDTHRMATVDYAPCGAAGATDEDLDPNSGIGPAMPVSEFEALDRGEMAEEGDEDDDGIDKLPRT